MNHWRRLSPLTKAVVILVLGTCFGLTYKKQRYDTQQARLADRQSERIDLEDALDSALIQIERLRTESNAAERWASYALVLDHQTTGQSFRDILGRAGKPGRSQLDIRQVEFERTEPRHGFPTVGVRFQVYGPYHRILDFLHEIDNAFPPVELTRSSITLAEDDEELDGHSGWVLAHLEGVLHEPQ